MSTKRTSLTSDTSASFEKSTAQLEVNVEIEAVDLDEQSCDEVFFDVFITKDLKFTLGSSGGNTEKVGKVTHTFEDYVSFQDASDQSFNRAGIVGKPELTVIGQVREIITKKDPDTEQVSKKAVVNPAIKFIFDEDSQKIVTSPPVSVFALIKAKGGRTSTRYRWTGPEKSKHIIYALHEETGKSATLEVSLEECDKGDKGKVSGKDLNNLKLGTVLTEFMVSDALTVGGPDGSTYATYGSFVVWPVPTFANFYAVHFNNADVAAFHWGDLAVCLESQFDRQQAELLAFTNSENGSLQYAPLGNEVEFKIVGDFTGVYENKKTASVVALKGPGSTVYKRTYKEYTYIDPLTQKAVKGRTPVDESIKVGPSEVYCVDWINNVIVKGTGVAVATYSCPARAYSFKYDAPTAEPFWTKWNCTVSMGYFATDTTFGPLSGNGTLAIPDVFKELKAMWNKQREDRIKYLKDLGFSEGFAMKGNY